MPRAATPSSRSRRTGRKTRSAPTKRATAKAPSATAEGEEVKKEPKDAALADSQQTISPPPPTKHSPILSNRRRPWKHPDELEYIKPEDWDEDQIIGFLCKNGFSVPRRLSHAQSPWCEVTDRNGDAITVPRGYRLPLMFAAKFQWESLRLVMTSAKRNEEWDDYKFDILHVSRLCKVFLEQAKAAMGTAGMDRSWRCPMFDRALTRYYRRWLVNREEFVRDFWLEYKEEEYERDILKGDWVRFVQKGHKGFSLTRDEINNGITFQEYTDGLSFIGGRLNWKNNHESAQSRNISHAEEPAAEEAEESQTSPPPLVPDDIWKAHKARKRKADALLSPAAITIKLEQIVDDPNFFLVGLSKNHEVIDVDATPEYEPPPPTTTDNHADDETTTGKPMDIEPTCTWTNNPDDLYVPIMSTKVVEPIPTANESTPPSVEEIPEIPPTAIVHHPEPEPVVDSISSADVFIPEVNPDVITMNGNGVSVESPHVISSQDVEMGDVDETLPPEEEREDQDVDQDPHLTPIENHDFEPPIQEPSSPEIPPLPFSPSDLSPAPLNRPTLELRPMRTMSAEPQRSEPMPLSDVEMTSPTSQPSRPRPLSADSKMLSRFSRPRSEQPSPTETKMNAWDVRVHAALQRVQRLTKPIQPTIGDQGEEGAEKPPSRHSSTEVELLVNGDPLQQPIELPRREATPRVRSPTPFGSSRAVPVLRITTVSPENLTDDRSEVAAGKDRQVDPEPLVEEVRTEGREEQRPTEPAVPAQHVEKPTPPQDMDMEIREEQSLTEPTPPVLPHTEMEIREEEKSTESVLPVQPAQASESVLSVDTEMEKREEQRFVEPVSPLLPMQGSAPPEDMEMEIREDQRLTEPASPTPLLQEPVSPVVMATDTTDAESMSISQAPRARSRRPRSIEHAFVKPNLRNVSLSSVSTYHHRSVSEDSMQSDHDNGPVMRQVVSMFRETLSGVLESLERGTMISPSAHPQQFMSTASASASASISSAPDSSIVGELLDEIRSLKHQIREDADRRSEQNLEVQRLQSQVDDLRRHVRMIDSQSRMSIDVEDENRVPESPATSSYSTFSPQVRRRLAEPESSSVISSHPLAHLLAMDLDDPLSNGSRAETTSANGSPWSTPDISTPIPCPKPPAPHNTAPLPIKSQRKHRMMFFPPPKQP
ncbi:hypothetical protein BDZ94DRAFT_254155 [Collybia nuda]|uniref:Uncharacterized protein n=1 Tax=Collybia nuda TaxID=64659 RepID=A0A9P5XUY1_9AGAR|nr:hypothetical protein BDZ94DRAFT_254155 [Collybia nuda]